MHENLRDERGLLYHYVVPGGSPEVRGLLTDQAAYLRALIDAHETSGEPRFLERALALADAVLVDFSAEDGGFFDRAPEHSEVTLGRYEKRVDTGQIPATVQWAAGSPPGRPAVPAKVVRRS